LNALVETLSWPLLDRGIDPAFDERLPEMSEGTWIMGTFPASLVVLASRPSPLYNQTS
jgi:hypothetical protein